MGIERAIEIQNKIEALKLWYSNKNNSYYSLLCGFDLTKLEYIDNKCYHDISLKAPEWFKDTVKCEMSQKIEEFVEIAYEKEMKRLREEFLKEKEAIESIFNNLD